MTYAAELGRIAALINKQAMHIQRARSGRNVKGENMKKHLHAAGHAKMNTGMVFSYPRGKNV